jgi:hypothetical protein
VVCVEGPNELTLLDETVTVPAGAATGDTCRHAAGDLTVQQVLSARSCILQLKSMQSQEHHMG